MGLRYSLWSILGEDAACPYKIIDAKLQVNDGYLDGSREAHQLNPIEGQIERHLLP